MNYYRPPSIDRLEQATLKECPHCGSSDLHFADMILACEFVVCNQCGMDGPIGKKSDCSAAVKWNSIPRRAEVRNLFIKMNTLAESMKLSSRGLLSMTDEDILRATRQNDSSVLPSTIQDLGTALQELYDYADKLSKEWNL